MSRPDPVPMLFLALRDPQAVLRWLRGLGLSGAERLSLLALVAALNVLSAEAFLAGFPDMADQGLAPLMNRPLLFAGLQLASLLIVAALIHHIGRFFGGVGDSAGAQVLVALLQAILFLFQIAQILALAVLPPLVPLIGLASIGAALWYLPHLVAGLHGFASVPKTFLGILASFVLLVFVLSLILAFAFGFETPDV